MHNFVPTVDQETTLVTLFQPKVISTLVTLFKPYSKRILLTWSQPCRASPDSVYTERYMGSPEVYPGSNYKGYEAADATKVVGNLKGKMFLLVHGTADDNVHYRHSMMLAKALVDEGVLFQQMVGKERGEREGGSEAGE